ncbi:MAG: hypothetical protein JXB48_15095 [Candidatus Latescibacteria bacterium]|nr:hypothetical protein [Candidatus Latescibacterota bacterium]
MKRRDLFIRAGGTAAITQMASVLASEQKIAFAGQQSSVSVEKNAFIRVVDNKVYVETKTQTTVIDKGFIVSLKSKTTGEEFIKNPDVNRSAALHIIYASDETAGINDQKFGSITTHQLSDHRAEIVFHSWDGDGVIALSVDAESGDLLVEPSAYSSRPGVRACRWCLTGLRTDLELVVPFFQGVKLPPNDPLIRNTRWEWPMYWEAGLAIFQSGQGGFWIHTQDNRYKYKALKVGSETDPFEIGLDSEAYGPVDNNLSAGGLCWRINVFKGNWHVPAEEYRSWYWQVYNLAVEERMRQPWIYDVKLAISWCPGEPDILDALAQKVSPKHILLHFPNWRTDEYDENYPNYTASEKGKAFIRKCRTMGFRIMPHFNAIDMDPSNPVYSQVRDFQFRTLEKKQLLGWSWYQGRGIGVPESNMNLLNNRDKKVMVKIHPGLGMWRSILGECILSASQALSLDTVFIDVTLHSYNLYNCFVETTTPSEGMKKLIKHVATLGQGLVVGGEGLNEITAQGQSFAQAHLFKSWHDSIDGLERAGGCNLNEFLFGKLCRTIGYSGLSGRNENEELRMRIHLEHGAIPTITIRSAQDIINPNPAVKRMLDMAG